MELKEAIKNSEINKVAKSNGCGSKKKKQMERILCFNWVFLQRCMRVQSPAGVWVACSRYLHLY